VPKARLIGLYSAAPASGKTTVAGYLAGHGFRIMPFAESLKRMASVFLTELGLTDSMLEHHLFHAKESRINAFGLNVTARHICQTLGTEWGRNCIHPDVWLHCWRRKAQQNLDRGIDVVVDDMRFVNEAELIRNLGGELWCIERPAVLCTTKHASEGSLDSYLFDRRIVNDGGLLELYAQVKTRVNALDEVAA